MKKFKIFNYLKSMTELQGRDDLSFLILTSLDYNMYPLPQAPPPQTSHSFILSLSFFPEAAATRELFCRRR